jgi:hypothetical protein
MFNSLKWLQNFERDIDRLFPDEELSKRDRLAIAAQVKPKPWPEFARGTYIRTGKSIQPFEVYQYQRRMIELIEAHRGAVIVKTRQLGATEALASWMLQKAVEDPSFSGVAFSKNANDTANISRRVSLMAATAQLKLTADNTERIETENGGQIFFRPSTTDSGRGLESVHTLLFDEAAFQPNLSRLFSASSPSQSMLGDDARTVFISTPSAMSGMFWQLLSQGNPGGMDILKVCNQVANGELYSDDLPGFYYFTDSSGWVKIVLHHRAHPVFGKDPNYLETVRERDKLSEDTLQREFNLSFETAGGAVFNQSMCDRAMRGRWLPRYPKRRYLLACDPALGGNDYFTAGILDITAPTTSLVAWVHEHLKTTDYYIERILDLIDDYAPTIAVIEQNNGGQVYIDQLVLKRPRLQIEGVHTSNQSKPVMVGKLNLLLERDQLELPPEPLIRDEFRNFMKNEDGKMAAAQGFNDDIVMMLAIASTQIDLSRRITQLQPRQRKPNIPTANDIFG